MNTRNATLPHSSPPLAPEKDPWLPYHQGEVADTGSQFMRVGTMLNSQKPFIKLRRVSF